MLCAPTLRLALVEVVTAEVAVWESRSDFDATMRVAVASLVDLFGVGMVNQTGD